MNQLPGFKDSTYPERVCLLKKALYSLKQASRAWFDRFNIHLLHLEFM